MVFAVSQRGKDALKTVRVDDTGEKVEKSDPDLYSRYLNQRNFQKKKDKGGQTIQYILQ